MPAPEPVSIQEVFKDVSERLLGRMQEAEKIDADEITAAVAREFGVPLDHLIEAVSRELVPGLLMLAIKGPQLALATSQIAAFLAGVAWEQGRRG
ncbi:MAG TPA: hypothetical protein VN752_05555 [Solirubrobacterales bacterium]|nr:hypothetical protein [Solirubrobacterales bacterium]